MLIDKYHLPEIDLNLGFSTVEVHYCGDEFRRGGREKRRNAEDASGEGGGCPEVPVPVLYCSCRFC